MIAQPDQGLCILSVGHVGLAIGWTVRLEAGSDHSGASARVQAGRR